jgi:hypothetical protein
VLVGPGRIAAGLVDHAEHRVGSDEIPRIHGIAVVKRIAHEFLRIDRFDASVDEAVRTPAIQLGLVDIVPFLIFRARAVGAACMA